MGARILSGDSELLDELERRLAAFVSKKDAVLLNFGYQGMISALDCLVDAQDVIIFDSEVHACILDGIRLHEGKRIVFPHNDVRALEDRLERAARAVRQSGGSILVITEGVFSMSGDQARLREIVELKKRFAFRLMVDDAHGFGTMGKSGAGTGEEQGVQGEIDIYYATFAKAMASIGAFIASERRLVDHLRYNMRSQMFSKVLPLPIVAGALKRLELLVGRPELRKRLWTNVRSLHTKLKANGFDIGRSNSPVTPVYLSGSMPEMAQFLSELRERHHIFCSAVIYPVVPKGVVMVRLIPTALHTLEDIEYTVSAFSTVRATVGQQSFTTVPAASSAI
jgi:glycine C-acetyltransferase